jgi:hypothetical protein
MEVRCPNIGAFVAAIPAVGQAVKVWKILMFRFRARVSGPLVEHQHPNINPAQVIQFNLLSRAFNCFCTPT